MSSTTIPAEIPAFADSVRQTLGDLPAEEVDDLTDGLEADLAEEYAGQHPRALPEPSAYAMELRTAAGLPLTANAPTGFRAETAGLARSGCLRSLPSRSSCSYPCGPGCSPEHPRNTSTVRSTTTKPPQTR